MADVQRYGAEPGIDYYVVREGAGMGAPVAVTYRIDELGHTERIAVAQYGAYTLEEIAALPTLGEATELHLKPALERAEANRKAWLRQREKNGEKPRETSRRRDALDFGHHQVVAPDDPDEPPPPPMDLATQRFLGEDA